MYSPYADKLHPEAVVAAEQLMTAIRIYMRQHAESELHRCGKMFGVLLADGPDGQRHCLRAFSAMLDGSYHHEGFVPPVYDLSDPLGYFKQEEAAISALNRQLDDTADADRRVAIKQERKLRSQALQRWMFGQYRMLDMHHHEKDLLELFADTAPIVSADDYFGGHRRPSGPTLPPSGAGECCAPKLLQEAFRQGLTPVCMAEFWMGASPANDLRREGLFYPPCQGKCRPILTHMLHGLVTLDGDEAAAFSTRELAEEIRIVRIEADWILIDKPSGLLSVPGRAGAYSATDYMRERYGADCHAVHRLDQDTSGMLLFARSKAAMARLQRKFQDRQMQKRYTAVLEGPWPVEKPLSGIIDLPLLPNPYDRPRQMVDHRHGKAALTRYEVQQIDSDGRVHITFWPETGRTHQLRVHAAHPDGLNCPIVGDRLYGSGTGPGQLRLRAEEIRLINN